MNKDAIVAEAVGYTLWEQQRSKYLMQYVIRPGRDPNDKMKKKNFRQLDWNEYKLGSVYVKEPKFISAPTAETDWIVLEWVQGQGRHSPIFGKFLKQVKKLYMAAHDEWIEENNFIGIDWEGFGSESARDRAANWIVSHLHYYEPRIYAKALLAVTKEARGE